VRKSAPHRKGFEVGSAAHRSAIGNGSRLLEHLDGRSAPARRYRDLQHAFARDIAPDPGALSEMQVQLIRSAAGLVVLREALDAKSLNGEAIDIGNYTRIANTLRRVATTLGLERHARVIDGHGDGDPDAAFRQELIDILRDEPDEPDEQSEARS
jgi:hypothetical protein